MDLVSILIGLASGAVGGNIVGKLVKGLDLGTIGNSIAGIVGGGLGAQILSLLGVAAASNGSLDLTSILGSIASGGVGGGVLMAIVGAIKKAMAKS